MMLVPSKSISSGSVFYLTPLQPNINLRIVAMYLSRTINIMSQYHLLKPMSSKLLIFRILLRRILIETVDFRIYQLTYNRKNRPCLFPAYPTPVPVLRVVSDRRMLFFGPDRQVRQLPRLSHYRGIAMLQLCMPSISKLRLLVIYCELCDVSGYFCFFESFRADLKCIFILT